MHPWPVPGFGVDGIVDLKQNNDQDLDPITSELAWNGAPVVAGDVVLVGAASRSGRTPPSRRNAKGYVRGFDARTGERKWIFHTIPQPGEFGNETWEDGSWEYTGNTGVWTQMTVDTELGIAYLPVEIPTNDYYGGHRPGDNLFAESLVAVDVETGEQIWHFQFVHHPVWDYDVPCAPILADITVDGREIKAIAQPTKQGWVYVFDRVTGEPVWPIEERPVPAGDVPGEALSPTQPFVTKPPPFERQGFELEEIIDLTPELEAEALRIIQQYRFGPVFTPPITRGAGDKLGTLFVPNGANWPGGSYDPETGILYVFSHTLTRILSMQNDPRRSDMDYLNLPAGGPGMTVQGLPLMRPPWGRITAIDLNRGEIVWQVAHGETPDWVKEHPALQGVDIPRLRQGDRRGRGRGLHPGPADRDADDLPDRRPAVPGGGGRGTGRAGRAAGVRASGVRRHALTSSGHRAHHHVLGSTGGVQRKPTPTRRATVLHYILMAGRQPSEPAESPGRSVDQRSAASLLGDTKWIVGSIIGTGGVIATLLLAIAGLMIQQNASVNARIDDVHRRIDDVHEDIRELRTLVVEALKRPAAAD